jgi:diadenosine tetraphosphate (Ap4A) HIT family hydrolase
VKVKKGDRVRRGQLLARIGDSGNSNAPHLHFHVSDGPTFDTEGLPFVFEGFDLLGKTTADRVFGPVPNPDASGFTSQRRRHEIPLNDVVIRFSF